MTIVPGGWTGAELEGIVCRHPWLDRDSKIVLGDYVTQDQGTGCVHIAPGHGQEDYEVGMRYGLPVMAPVDPARQIHRGSGRFARRVGVQSRPAHRSKTDRTRTPCSKKTS